LTNGDYTGLRGKNLINGCAVASKNKLFHELLKGNLGTELSIVDELQLFMHKLYTYLYSDEELVDIDNKERVAEDLLELVDKS
jgi:hypothetical protein